MAGAAKNLSRFTANLVPSNKEYLELLADENKFPGGLTDALNAVIGLARRLGALGVTDRLAVPDPVTGESMTYLLPMFLVDPTAQPPAPEVPPAVAE